MQLLFNSTTLTKPTAETLQEYATKRFAKLNRYISNLHSDFAVRITVHKERYLFVVCVEITVPKRLVIKTKHEDLRAAIDNAYAALKNLILREKGKLANH